MHTFLQLSRQAFRQLHGLPGPDEVTRRDEISDHLLEWARQHRVLGLLDAGLFRGAGPDRWKKAVYGQVHYTAQCTSEAEHIFQHLQSCGIESVIIKGPALAAQAWPDPGLRCFDDLDFRCPRSSYDGLNRTLPEIGYTPEIPSEHHRSHAWHYGWGVTFIGPGQMRLEINHRMFPRHYPWPKNVHISQPHVVETQKLDHASVTTLTPAIHLVLCCLHAVWHGWERLAWVVDIAGLLARHPDAFSLADQWVARTGFPRRALHAGCAVAEDIFGPGLVAGHLSREPAPVIEDARNNLMRSTPSLTMAQQRHCHNRLMSEREKWRYHLIRLTTPGDNDFKQLELPASLRGLYWLYRPFRGLASSFK